MNNQATNAAFLAATDEATRNEVLAAVAIRYGITRHEALSEVTREGAEHLLDYLTGTVRTAISVLMRRHGLSVP